MPAKLPGHGVCLHGAASGHPPARHGQYQSTLHESCLSAFFFLLATAQVHVQLLLPPPWAAVKGRICVPQRGQGRHSAGHVRGPDILVAQILSPRTGECLGAGEEMCLTQYFLDL